MKAIMALFVLLWITPTYAAGSFDRYAAVINAMDVATLENSWERSYTQRDWQVILENCYDRVVNSDARAALVERLQQNGVLRSNGGLSQRDIDAVVAFYCSHALYLASSFGLKLRVVPLAFDDPKPLYRARIIESCYQVRRVGFSSWFRDQIKMVVAAQREVAGESQAGPVKLSEILTAYPTVCGVVFSEDPKIPVSVTVFDQ